MLELVSNLGIVISTYIVVFTSDKMTSLADWPDHFFYVIAFALMHLIFALKFVLATVIEDVPEWIEQD